nr:MAG TPA: hypothetical protein [Caudoviricetes sp.]
MYGVSARYEPSPLPVSLPGGLTRPELLYNYTISLVAPLFCPLNFSPKILRSIILFFDMKELYSRFFTFFQIFDYFNIYFIVYFI